jgi:hypothetical protein
MQEWSKTLLARVASGRKPAGFYLSIINGFSSLIRHSCPSSNLIESGAHDNSSACTEYISVPSVPTLENIRAKRAHAGKKSAGIYYTALH